MTCPGGFRCKDSLCDRYTAKCDGCETNYYGTHCENECLYCVNGTCDQDTGICTAECVPGYFGIKCDQTCHDRCTICDQLTGSCEICDIGTFGTSCEYDCSRHCYTPLNQPITCSKNGGICDEGQCDIGYYTHTCNTSCSQNCFTLQCDIDSGECVFGCNIGKYGPTCDGNCSETCLNRNCKDSANNCQDGCVNEYYGALCDTRCSENCLTENCDDLGYCIDGCDNGWYGDRCNFLCSSTCTDDRCDRVSGVCAECTQSNPSPLCRTSSKY